MNSLERIRPTENESKMADKKLEAKKEKSHIKEINYDRLRQFFFDLCASWCQFLDIEIFLFFLNAVFLNVKFILKSVTNNI